MMPAPSEFNKLCFGLLLLVCLNHFVICENEKPHIIVMLADDMGWNDVSFHGADQIPTPNIDALAYNGIILNNHYSQALCTPSRAAFLTGKYPIHMGMQHSVLLEPEPRGLPLEEKLMPEYLREAGYSTHAIGKWHLGFYKKEYTPLFRGFDSHYGYWNGLQDYYSHITYVTFDKNVSGYDMRRNLNVDWDAKGKYSTTLFTNEAVRVIHEHNNENPMFMYLSHLAPHSGNRNEPLQAPDEEIAKFAHIPDPDRRTYAAMVSMLDKSVGTVIAALREKRMLENSIILFISDNGAQTFGVHANYGSNYPLKGMKATPWEGGSKSVATIWSPLLKKTQYVSDELMHISDWLPTLMTAIGVPVKHLGPIDGINMWESLSTNTKSPRQEMVYNIDDTFNYSAIRRGDWKYVFGTLSLDTDGWYGDSGLGEQYTYEEEEVLLSKVNIALTGVITKQQIKEKHTQGFKNIYSQNLLTKAKIQSLRNQSTIQCSKSDSTEFKCNPLESPCLFNLREDPCEMINYARERPVILKNLENALAQIRLNIIPQTNVPSDPNANPINWNNTWVNWQDCEIVRREKIDSTLSPTSLAILGVLCTLFFIIVMVLIAISVKSSSMKKQTSHNDLFTRHDDGLDAPTGVVNIISDSNDNINNLNKIDGKNFQNNELTRHDSIKHTSRNIH